MRELLRFSVRALPLTLGLVLVLTALSFLVGFADGAHPSKFAEEDFVTFVLLSIVGIPMLLFGIKKLSNDEVH